MFWIQFGGEKNRRRNCTVETNKRAPPTEIEESTGNTRCRAQQSRELWEVQCKTQRKQGALSTKDGGNTEEKPLELCYWDGV